MRIVTGEERSESFSNSQTGSMDYTDIDDDMMQEEIYDSNIYTDDVDQARREQSPRGRANNRNQSVARPQIRQRNMPRDARDRAEPYEDDVGINARRRQAEEGHLARERKHKKDQQEGYRQQGHKHTRQDIGRIASGVTGAKETPKTNGKYIEPTVAPKDKYMRRQRNTNGRTGNEYMQSSTGNLSITESIPRDTRFPHPHKYSRAREDDSEYTAILDDYAELYKIRITIPEEQVAMLSRELKTIKGQVTDIQSQLDDAFAAVLGYVEEGKQDVRQLISGIESINNNMSTFYNNVDMKLRDANEQISANHLLLKAAPAPEQQRDYDGFLELIDTHLKASLASYLPVCLQSSQNYPSLDGKVANDGAVSNCEAVEPMAVSVRQLRAPLPLTDNSSVEEKYKILEQKYNRALVTIKAMRLTAGFDCVPINTEADYLEFLRELESRTGPANSEFSRGRYMLRIRGINDGTDAYVGILDVTSDDNILLRHRRLPDTLSTDTSEQLKKDMVMRINDMSYVVHEIYESLLPPPSIDNEQG